MRRLAWIAWSDNPNDPTNRFRGTNVFPGLAERLGWEIVPHIGGWDSGMDGAFVQYHWGYQAMMLALPGAQQDLPMVMDMNDNHLDDPVTEQAVRLFEGFSSPSQRILASVLRKRLPNRNPRRVCQLPDIIDQPDLRDLDRDSVGWIGFLNLQYILPIAKEIARICDRRKMKFRVMDHPGDPYWKEMSKYAEMVPWSLEAVPEFMSRLAVCMIPLPPDEWCMCKSNNKVITAMAYGAVPLTVSYIPTYTAAITHGNNGLLCSSTKDIPGELNQVLGLPAELKAMSRNALMTYHYSHNPQSLLSVWERGFKYLYN